MVDWYYNMIGGKNTMESTRSVANFTGKHVCIVRLGIRCIYNLDVCDWVMSPKVLTFVLCQSGWFVTLDMGSTDKHPDGEAWCMKLSDFGKTIFLTREEAEKALKDGAE